MNKPKKECEIRLTVEDVADAITLWLHQNEYQKVTVCDQVKKTRSRKWFLIARIK